MSQNTTVCMITAGRHDDARLYEKEARTLREYGRTVVILCGDYEGVDSSGIRFVKVKGGSGFFAGRRLIRASKRIQAGYYHLYGAELLRLAKPLHRRAKVIWEPAAPAEWEEPEARNLKRLFGVVVSTPKGYSNYKPHVRRTFQLGDYPVEEAAEKRRFLRREPNEMTVCRMGELSEQGGLFPLLEAVSLLKCKLTLLGPFSDEVFEERVRQSEAFSPECHLKEGSKKEFRKLLSEASAGVVTPLAWDADRGLPSELFSYMAMGLPVIVPNFAPFRDIIEEYNCGICVNPSNSEEISSAVAYIGRNPDVAAEMGENGKKAVRTRFHWEGEKEKLALLYRCSLL